MTSLALFSLEMMLDTFSSPDCTISRILTSEVITTGTPFESSSFAMQAAA